MDGVEFGVASATDSIRAFQTIPLATGFYFMVDPNPSSVAGDTAQWHNVSLAQGGSAVPDWLVLSFDPDQLQVRFCLANATDQCGGWAPATPAPGSADGRAQVSISFAQCRIGATLSELLTVQGDGIGGASPTIQGGVFAWYSLDGVTDSSLELTPGTQIPLGTLPHRTGDYPSWHIVRIGPAKWDLFAGYDHRLPGAPRTAALSYGTANHAQRRLIEPANMRVTTNVLPLSHGSIRLKPL